MLINCSFPGVFGEAYRIKLTPDISLLEHEKTKLLHQVQAVYGNKVQQLEIISKKTTTTADKSQSSYLGLNQLNPQSIWYKVREYLIKLHGELIDKSWFSQLEAVEEDMTCKKKSFSNQQLPSLVIGFSISMAEICWMLLAIIISLLSLYKLIRVQEQCREIAFAAILNMFIRGF